MDVKILPLVKKITKNIFHLNPRIKVNHKCNTEKHGNEYGGWTICPDGVTKNSIVYSFGIGEDISFDLSLIEKYDCQVYGFDPTPKSVSWISNQKLPSNFRFYKVGLSDTDSLVKFYPPENENNVSYSVFAKYAGQSVENGISILKFKNLRYSWEC